VIEPFPEEVPVPPGMVTPRLRPHGVGVPPWLFSLLLVVVGAPLWVWGLRKWWVSVLGVGVGWVVAMIVRDDPYALTAWYGEMRLRDYYD
jgi:hypothetical protein